MESADRESRRLDILSVKKEANLSAREVGEVEVGKGDLICIPGEGTCSVSRLPSLSLMGRVCVCVCVALPPLLWTKLVDQAVRQRGWVCGTTGGSRDLVPVIYRLPSMNHCFSLSVLIPACMPRTAPRLSTPPAVSLGQV